MAIINPPSWLQAGTYSARADRLGIGSLLDRSGVNSSTSYNVTPTLTPSMSVQVSAGAAFIENTYGIAQGYYTIVNDAPIVVALDASHPNFSRIDLIILRVKDATYEGAENEAVVEKLTGLAALSPVAQVLPGNSIVLATITVPAQASAITTTNINLGLPRRTANLKSALVNAVEPVTLSTTPSSPSVGKLIYETDTGFLKIWVGVGWRILSPTVVPNVLSTNRPAGVSVKPGMIIYETDTKRYHTYDGVKWNYLSGGGGDGLTTAFSFTPTYTQPANAAWASTVTYQPLSLWVDGSGRVNLEGTIASATPISGWTEYALHQVTTIPQTKYYPVYDMLQSTVVVAADIGHIEGVIVVKGTNPQSQLPGVPGALFWQPQVSRAWSVPAGALRVAIPHMTWTYGG